MFTFSVVGDSRGWHPDALAYLFDRETGHHRGQVTLIGPPHNPASDWAKNALTLVRNASIQIAPYLPADW